VKSIVAIILLVLSMQAQTKPQTKLTTHKLGDAFATATLRGVIASERTDLDFDQIEANIKTDLDEMEAQATSPAEQKSFDEISKRLKSTMLFLEDLHRRVLDANRLVLEQNKQAEADKIRAEALQKQQREIDRTKEYNELLKTSMPTWQIEAHLKAEAEAEAIFGPRILPPEYASFPPPPAVSVGDIVLEWIRYIAAAKPCNDALKASLKRRDGTVPTECKLTPQQAALRQSIVNASNAEFKQKNVPGYEEITGDNLIVHGKTMTAESFQTFFSSLEFQQLIPILKQLEIATLTYTNDASLTFVYDVNAGQLVGAPSQAAVRQSILNDFNAEKESVRYAEITGSNLIFHKESMTKDSLDFLSFFSGPDVQQQFIPLMKRAGITTITFTNDADLTFVYDVNAGHFVVGK
jgi:hypothetical protein